MEIILAIIIGVVTGAVIGFVIAQGKGKEKQNTIDKLQWQLDIEKQNAQQIQANLEKQIESIKADCDKNGNPYPEWSDLHGEFATTYLPRTANSERRIQSASDALKGALKNALKELGKNDGDDIVGKIVLVYEKIAENSNISLSAIAQMSGLSDRAVDEYVAILKAAGIMRRKDGKRFGHWELLM